MFVATDKLLGSKQKQIKMTEKPTSMPIDAQSLQPTPQEPSYAVACYLAHAKGTFAQPMSLKDKVEAQQLEVFLKNTLMPT